MTTQLPKVVLIGRPNVGKSTLFNRLVGRRQAIVDDIPGVTRDRQYGVTDWEGQYFSVVDTGGFVPGIKENVLAREVREQVFLALSEADCVVFVVDGRVGLTPVEEEIAGVVRKSKTPMILAVNKIDHPEQEIALGEFYRLGFDEIVGISAETGRGISTFLETVIPFLQKSVSGKPAESDVRLAILGQPNVGKSTLLNALIGEERAVVHHEAGTTLDPLNILLERGTRIFEFVDTAGIRKKRLTPKKIDKVGVLKALEAVRKAHLILLVVDATKGMTPQDAKILNYAQEQGKGAMILLNKWDLMPGGSKIKEFKERIFARFKRMEDIQVLALSAKSGRGISKLFGLIDQCYDNYIRRIGTGELNRVLQMAWGRNPHPSISGQRVHFSYVTQSNWAPPRFVLFCNRPSLVQESYLRYLERILRKAFKFSGVPLKWVLRQKR